MTEACGSQREGRKRGVLFKVTPPVMELSPTNPYLLKVPPPPK
jgi:hypothetical protein